jgi:hypothetical protein
MDQGATKPGAKKWGSILVEQDAEDLAATLQLQTGHALPAFTSLRHTWTPPADMHPELPEGFTLSLRSVVGPDGVRRFFPVDDLTSFFTDAFAGGLALHNRLKNMSPEQRYSYRAMWLLFQRIRATREHFANSFRYADSLRVSPSARQTAQQFSILPESVGLNDQGQGERWGVGRLLTEGWEEAREQGVQQPTEADCVHYGLVRAARMNPLRLRDEEVPSLIRMALYKAAELPASLDPAVLEVVVDRVLQAVNRHLGDKSAKFDLWFSGPHSSLVPQIANKKFAPGGVLDRNVVRRALLELGWDSYRYVADCVHTMMWVFQRLLPEPLTVAERRFFEQVYLMQPHFGQMPFILLAERFPFLKGILWQIWKGPGDPNAVPIMNRLLFYYGEIAAARRAADRQVKAKRAGQGETGKLTIECPLHPQIHLPAKPGVPTSPDDPDGAEAVAEGGPLDPEFDQPEKSAVPELWDALAERIRELRGVRCDCVLPKWEDKYLLRVGR